MLILTWTHPILAFRSEQGIVEASKLARTPLAMQIAEVREWRTG